MAFMRSWLQDKPMLPLEVMFYEGITGITLWRDGPFQVQLFIVAPNVGSPEHAHPNIETIDMGIFGDDDNIVGGRKHGPFVLVRAGEKHIAKAGPRGGAFYSFQHWLNGVQPTSVLLDWQGNAHDLRHAIETLTKSAHQNFEGAPI